MLRSAVIATIRSGTKNLTTNTARKIPTVKNSVCQNLDSVTSIRPLITALSKLKVTSRIVNSMTVIAALMPLLNPINAQIDKVDNIEKLYILKRPFLLDRLLITLLTIVDNDNRKFTSV